MLTSGGSYASSQIRGVECGKYSEEAWHVVRKMAALDKDSQRRSMQSRSSGFLPPYVDCEKHAHGMRVWDGSTSPTRFSLDQSPIGHTIPLTQSLMGL